MTHSYPDHHRSPSDDPPDDALRAIVAAAESLPPQHPSRDLWPGIAARLDTVPRSGASDDSAAGRSAARQPARRDADVLPFRVARTGPIGRGPWLAAAAVALAVVSSGATYLATRPPTAQSSVAAAGPTGRPISPPPPSTADADPSVPPDAHPPALAAVPVAADDRAAADPTARQRDALRPVTRSVDGAVPGALDYDREIAELRTAVMERHGALDSATVDVLTRNLRIIDAAISASRAALMRDPRSPFLGQQLTRSLGQKAELLRTVALLPQT